MSQLNLVLGLVGTTVLLIGLLASVFQRAFVAGPLAAMLVGVAIGPVAGWVDPSAWGGRGSIMEQLARFTLAFSLIEIALRLPAGKLTELRRSLTILLGGVMPFTWVATSLLVWWLTGLSFWMAVLVGAILTPTDPVVASAIVNGEVAEDRVPEDMRLTISAESGLNDGLALPFVLLPIIVMQHGIGSVPKRWLLDVVVWEVGAAVVIGGLIGYAAGAAWNRAESSERMDPPTVLMYSLALALVVLGIAKLIGSDDILAVFVTGIVFDRQISEESKSEERIQKAVNRFFTTPAFVLLGTTLPFAAWADMGWTAVALPVGVLALRRLPAVFAFSPLLEPARSKMATLFLGWFGPIGVASIYYAFLASRRMGDIEIWDIASLLIAASVVAHGATASWGVRRFPGEPGE